MWFDFVGREKKKSDIVQHDSEMKLALKNVMGWCVLSGEDVFYEIIKFFFLYFLLLLNVRDKLEIFKPW